MNAAKHFAEAERLLQFANDVFTHPADDYDPAVEPDAEDIQLRLEILEAARADAALFVGFAQVHATLANVAFAAEDLKRGRHEYRWPEAEHGDEEFLWPPRKGDIWRDSKGDKWAMNPCDGYLVCLTRTADDTPDEIRRTYGPMTLSHRPWLPTDDEECPF